MDHPESVPTADQLLAEALGLPPTNSSDLDPVKRILRCIPYANTQLADDLRGAILARGPTPVPAEPYTAVA